MGVDRRQPRSGAHDLRPPKYRFQAVYDGDDASRFGEYDRALALYQQAVFDEALLGWNPDFNPYSALPVDPRIFLPEKALSPLDKDFNWKVNDALLSILMQPNSTGAEILDGN